MAVAHARSELMAGEDDGGVRAVRQEGGARQRWHDEQGGDDAVQRHVGGESKTVSLTLGESVLRFERQRWASARVDRSGEGNTTEVKDAPNATCRPREARRRPKRFAGRRGTTRSRRIPSGSSRARLGSPCSRSARGRHAQGADRIRTLGPDGMDIQAVTGRASDVHVCEISVRYLGRSGTCFSFSMRTSRGDRPSLPRALAVATCTDDATAACAAVRGTRRARARRDRGRLARLRRRRRWSACVRRGPHGTLRMAPTRERVGRPVLDRSRARRRAHSPERSRTRTRTVVPSC